MNRKRLVDHLLKLVQINSHSRKEGAIAKHLKEYLGKLGIEAAFDNAGEKAGGEVGNLVAHLPGNMPDIPPLLLAAHMDTVAPGIGVKPIIENDIIKSDGTTILGGDDKSGVAIICELIQTIKEEKVHHGPIDIVFTICEEAGLLGAKYLDLSLIKAKQGIVLDSDNPAHLITKAPAADRMEFTIHGVEAHAGVCPEKGISAIQVAGEAIASMKLGRIDSETTANIGVIEGGIATNIIPKLVKIRAEARSHDMAKLDAQSAHMKNCFESAAARHTLEIDGKKFSAKVETQIEREYFKMNVPDSAPIVQLVKQAAANLKYNLDLLATGGGCDANILNGRGLEVVNLGTGMCEIHTVNEFLHLGDFYKSAEIILEIIKVNAIAKTSAAFSS